ncbi:signal peptidase II [Roseomonas sp. KE2513]|uniref:signal peptidase II n=1 Tax=Roseomonas sp. KE2513 TaxID=2479202 RepID=UPI0018DF9F89|nr:signal peptidase II [Roseomonas sp. KE2513]MBI0539745.1 signal peptidase II [Roseomonas sp. KE2513]
MRAALKFGFPAALAAFAVDQATKAWALFSLWPPYTEGIYILPVLNLRLGFNTGVTFGMFAGGGTSSAWALSALGLAVCGWLMAWMWKSVSRAEILALGLIVGGALGNVLDRIRQGKVTDFIDAHYSGWHWPTFNMADVAIVCGVAILMIGFLRPMPSPAHQNRSSQ